MMSRLKIGTNVNTSTIGLTTMTLQLWILSILRYVPRPVTLVISNFYTVLESLPHGECLNVACVLSSMFTWIRIYHRSLTYKVTSGDNAAFWRLSYRINHLTLWLNDPPKSLLTDTPSCTNYYAQVNADSGQSFNILIMAYTLYSGYLFSLGRLSWCSVV